MSTTCLPTPDLHTMAKIDAIEQGIGNSGTITRLPLFTGKFVKLQI
jgi:hypothetical protein